MKKRDIHIEQVDGMSLMDDFEDRTDDRSIEASEGAIWLVVSVIVAVTITALLVAAALV